MLTHKQAQNDNQVVALETGIRLARGVYREGLYAQGIMFSWEHKPAIMNAVLEHMKDQLDVSQEESLSLFSFATHAYETEISNLKDKHIAKHGSLPINSYSDQEIINFLTIICTETFVYCYPSEFKESLIEQGVDDAEHIWRKLFLSKHSISSVKNLSICTLDDKLWNKRITPAIQEAVLYEIDSYWANVKTLSDILD